MIVVYYNPLSSHVIDDFAFLPHRQEINLPYDFTREMQRRVAVYHN